MKRFLCIFMLFSFAVSLPAHSIAEGNTTLMSRQTTDYFGTVSALFLYVDASDPNGLDRFLDTWAAVKEILARIEADVSLSVPDSDIARFNQLSYGQQIAVSNHTATILRTAKDVYENTGGLFDPTIFPLVDLWGFSPRFNVNNYTPVLPYDRDWQDGKLPMPDLAYIESLTALVDFSGVLLSGSEAEGYTLTKNIPSVTIDGYTYQAQLDLGAVAKGYAADCVLELLKERGYEYGHFVCGGSSMAILKNGSESAQASGTAEYALGIRKPRAGASKETSFMSISAQNVALSSSGDYSHNVIYDDVLYCHIIDPRTGYPINTLASGTQKGIAAVTLLCGNAAYADAITTALCVMGPLDAIRYANEHLSDVDLAMVFYSKVTQTYEVVTNIEEDRYKITDDAYLPVSETDARGAILYLGDLFSEDDAK